MIESLSLYELQQMLDSFTGGGISDDYTPPDFGYVDDNYIVLNKGRYFKAGLRSAEHYTDYDGMSKYWDLLSDIQVLVNTTYSGIGTSGFLNGAKVNDAWYAAYMLDGTPTVLLLPLFRVYNLDNTTMSGCTTITPSQYGNGGVQENDYVTVSGMYNGYRAIGQSLYTWDPNDGYVMDIIDSPTGKIIVDGLHTSPVDAYGPAWANCSGTLYLYGGSTNDANFYTSLYRYFPDIQKWERLANGPSGYTQHAIMAWDQGDILYLFGGWNGSAATNNLWKYTISTDTWVQLSPNGTPPVARFVPAMIYDPVNNQLLMHGGTNNTTDYQDIWKYTIADNTWTQISATSSCGTRQAVGFFYRDGEFYIHNGYNRGGATNYDSFYKYNIAGNSWSQVTNDASRPSATRIHRMEYDPVEDLVYMTGGYHDSNYAVSHLYKWDPTTNTWESLGELPYPLYGHAMSYYEGEIVISQGYETNYYNRHSETWRFNLSREVWEPIDSAGLVSATYGNNGTFGGSVVVMAPPASQKCLYLGCVRIDSSGHIQEFIKEGWTYKWKSVYGAVGSRGASFGNTFLGHAAPAVAKKAKVVLTTREVGGEGISCFRIGLASGMGGGSFTVGFDAPSLAVRQNCIVVLMWYKENSSNWQAAGQSVSWLFTRREYIRNRFHAHGLGTQRTPDYGYLTISEFTE